MDETYVEGQWPLGVSVQAVDSRGRTAVDFISPPVNSKAAYRFLVKSSTT